MTTAVAPTATMRRRWPVPAETPRRALETRRRRRVTWTPVRSMRFSLLDRLSIGYPLCQKTRRRDPQAAVGRAGNQLVNEAFRFRGLGLQPQRPVETTNLPATR